MAIENGPISFSGYGSVTLLNHGSVTLSRPAKVRPVPGARSPDANPIQGCLAMLDMPTPILPPMSPPDVRPPPVPPRMTAPANLDRILHALQSRFTAGRSPSTVSLAFLDWAAHAANAPFQTAALGRTALAQWLRLVHTAMGGENAIAPQPGNHRFAHPAWQQRPYDLLIQAVLLGAPDLQTENRWQCLPRRQISNN